MTVELPNSSANEDTCPGVMKVEAKRKQRLCRACSTQSFRRIVLPCTRIDNYDVTKRIIIDKYGLIDWSANGSLLGLACNNDLNGLFLAAIIPPKI